MAEVGGPKYYTGAEAEFARLRGRKSTDGLLRIERCRRLGGGRTILYSQAKNLVHGIFDRQPLELAKPCFARHFTRQAFAD